MRNIRGSKDVGSDGVKSESAQERTKPLRSYAQMFLNRAMEKAELEAEAYRLVSEAAKCVGANAAETAVRNVIGRAGSFGVDAPAEVIEHIASAPGVKAIIPEGVDLFIRPKPL